MSSCTSILKGLWVDEVDASSQLLCLHELNHALALGHGNNVRSAAYIPALAKVLKKPGTNFEVTLLALRGLNNILDLQPLCGEVAVEFDILPVLCAKLNNIQDLDIAAQALKCLKFIAKSSPGQVIRAGGLKALIAFFDFFPSNLQVQAAETLVALCASVTAKAPDMENVLVENARFVLEALPYMEKCLQSKDKQILQLLCSCYQLLVENYSKYKGGENGGTSEQQLELIRQVLNESVVRKILQLVLVKDVLESELVFPLLRCLSHVVVASPELVKVLFENQILQILQTHVLNCETSFKRCDKVDFVKLESNTADALALALAILPVLPKHERFLEERFSPEIVQTVGDDTGNVSTQKSLITDAAEEMTHSQELNSDRPQVASSGDGTATGSESDHWSCLACTYHNASTASACEMCGQVCPAMKARALETEVPIPSLNALIQEREKNDVPSVKAIFEANPLWFHEYFETLLSSLLEILYLSGDPKTQRACIQIASTMFCFAPLDIVDAFHQEKKHEVTMLCTHVFSSHLDVVAATLECLMIQVFRLGEGLGHWLRREGIFYRVSFLRQASETSAWLTNAQPISGSSSGRVTPRMMSDLSTYKVMDGEKERTILPKIHECSSFIVKQWNSLGGSTTMHPVNIKLKRLTEKMASMKDPSCRQPEEDTLLDFDELSKTRSKMSLNSDAVCHTISEPNVDHMCNATSDPMKTRDSRRPPKKRQRRSSSAMELVSVDLRGTDKLRPQEWGEVFDGLKMLLQSPDGVAANELMECGMISELKTVLANTSSEACLAFIQCFNPATLKTLVNLITVLLYRVEKLEVVHYGPGNQPAQVDRLTCPVSITLKPSPLCKELLGALGEVEELRMRVEPLATLRDVSSCAWEMLMEKIEQADARVMHKLHTKTRPHGTLPAVGTKVQRGKHWRWDTQDEGTHGMGGIVVETVDWRKGHVTGGQGVRVLWSFTNRCFTYRYGAEGAFDVQIYKPHSRREMNSAAMNAPPQDAITKMPKVKQIWRENLSVDTQVDFLASNYLWRRGVVKHSRPLSGCANLLLISSNDPLAERWVVSTSRRVVPRGHRCPFFLDKPDTQGSVIFSEDVSALEQLMRKDSSHELTQVWASSLQAGDKLEVEDGENEWKEAVVLRVAESKLLVHLIGYPPFKNAWFNTKETDRLNKLSPMYTHIKSGTDVGIDSRESCLPQNFEELKGMLFKEADLVIVKSSSRRTMSRRIAEGTEAFICVKVFSRFLWIKTRVESSHGNEKGDCLCVSYNNGSIFRDKIPRSEIAVTLPKKHELLTDESIQALMTKHSLTLEALAQDHAKDVDTTDDAEEEDDEDRDEESFKSSPHMDVMYDEDEEFEDLSGPLQRAVSLAITRFQEAQNRAEDSIDPSVHTEGEDSSYSGRERELQSNSDRHKSRGSNFVSRGSAARRFVSSSSDGVNLRNLGSRLAMALSQSHASSSSFTNFPDLGRLYAREALSMIQGQARNSNISTSSSSTASSSGRSTIRSVCVPLQVVCDNVTFAESCTILEVVQKVRRLQQKGNAERSGSDAVGIADETWHQYVWEHTQALDFVVNTKEDAWIKFHKKMVEVGQITAVNGGVSLQDSGICEVQTHFPTITAKGVWLKRGHWYYEVEVVNAGLAQIGWADPYFSPRDQKGLGCGDDIHSWAFDGLRIKRWNETSAVWGRRWKAGDVVGCAVSINAETNTLCIRFSLNGSWDAPMGIAYEKATFQGTAIRPVITFNSSFSCRVLLGEKTEAADGASLLPTRFDPPAPHFQRLAKFIKRANAKVASSSSPSLSGHPKRAGSSSLKNVDSQDVDELDSSFLSLLDVLNTMATTSPHAEIRRFFLPRLSQHLIRQLKDPVALCSGSLPGWCWKIPHEYKRLFPFQVRLRFFELTAFGSAQTVQRLRSDLEDTSNDSRATYRSELIRSLGLLPNDVGAQRKQKAIVLRSKILKSAMVLMEKPSSQKALLTVQFNGEVGHGLGPTLEFYSLVCRELQRTDLGIWREDAASSAMETDEGAKKYVHSSVGLFPKALPESSVGSKLKYFRLLGRFIGKAFYDDRMLDIFLSKTLCKILVGDKLSIEDVQEVDVGLGKSLMSLREMAAKYDRLQEELGSRDLSAERKSKLKQSIQEVARNVDSMCLDFTVPGSTREIVEGGADIPVTVFTLREYVMKLATQVLVKDVVKQVHEIKRGISELFSVDALRIFSAEELQSLLCTGKTSPPWTRDEIMRNIVCKHGYTCDSVVIKNLVTVLTELSPEEQKSFLRFTTGCARLPLGGWDNLAPKLTVVKKDRENKDSVLPSCSTCQVYLKLPPYSTLDVLRRQIKYAISEGQDFFALD